MPRRANPNDPLSRLNVTEVIELSPEASEDIVTTLLNPPEPSDRLRSAADRYRAMVDEREDDARDR